MHSDAAMGPSPDQGRGTRSTDVSRRTMSIINIIASWVVNSYYNILHQRADEMHKMSQVSTITDGYKLMVKCYLRSYDTPSGYLQNLKALHKYYIDNARCVATSFDAWTKEILQQFVPADYFPIMSNKQQDSTLRSVLLNAIKQFSVDVVCTSLLDRLIANHDDPTIVSTMKDSMKAALLFERERLFQAVFKSSTGAPDKPVELMKKELLKLVEENVGLRHKLAAANADIKKALVGLKTKDGAIMRLRAEIDQLRAQPVVVAQPAVVAPARPVTTTAFSSAIEHATGVHVPDITIPSWPSIAVAAAPPLTNIERPPLVEAEKVADMPEPQESQTTGSETLALDVADFLSM
jgi:hypothetical protein